MEKIYILCVAGQSNAVGYDESRIPADYTPSLTDSRICQLGFYGEDNLKRTPLPTLPVKACKEHEKRG